MLREIQRVPASPSPSHQDHIQRLLGARAAHSAASAAADVGASPFPDTPSVYSHGIMSPLPSVASDGFDSSFDLSPNPRSLLHHHNHHRFRPLLDDPQSSTLDFDDDDDDDTYPHPHSPPMSPVYDEDEDDPDYGTEEEPEPRLSLLGPKMRFHSPAPWELEHDPAAEDDADAEDDVRSVLSKRGKGLFKADGFVKSLGLKASSAAAAVAAAPRPSVDSSRSSSGREKKSFETTSSYVSAGGALHALAQASMSSTSLAINASSAASARAKFPVSRTRTHTEPPSSSSPAPGTSPSSNAYPSSGLGGSPADRHLTRSSSPAPSSVFSNTLSRTDTRASSRPASPSVVSARHGQDSFVHPYANPDVSSPYRESFQIPPAPTLAHAHRNTTGISSSESSSTVTGMSIHRPSSPQASIMTSSFTNNGDPSATTPPSRRPGGGVQGRTISGPIVPSEGQSSLKTMASSSSIRSRTKTSALPPPPSYLPTGFAAAGDLPSSPITLISLQEAQAQARERSRSTTTGGSQAPFLEQDPRETGGRSSFGTFARARSSSAGSKAKTALQGLSNSLGSSSSSPSASAPTPSSASARTDKDKDNDVSPVSQNAPAGALPRLRHKKSGFMRLFNGKDRDTDETPLPPLPPPVPALSLSSAASASTPSLVPRPPRPPQSRVPVPYLPPEEADESTSTGGAGGRTRNAVHRPNAPALAIVPPSDKDTHAPLYSLDAGNPSRSTLVPPPPIRHDSAPASAPPGSSVFPALSLRPVSTVFSAHFAEALGGGFALDLDAAAESDSVSPTSTGALSPLTPASNTHTHHQYPHQHSRSPPVVTVADGDGDGNDDDGDPRAVIQTLQAQLSAARKAWQRQIWELEGQVRDLRAEMEDMRVAGVGDGGQWCAYCGRGGGGGGGVERVGVGERDERVVRAPPRKASLPETGHGRHGVVNRPRARTGTGAHFGGAT